MTREVCSDWARPYSKADTLDDDEYNPKRTDQTYFVLIIISKGGVNDQQATLNALSEAVGLPISVIVIGVGNEDHSYFESLNDEANASQQLNLKVSCRMGHECHQVTQSPIKVCRDRCSECDCRVATCRTRWDCAECGFKMCEQCGIWVAQKMAN